MLTNQTGNPMLMEAPLYLKDLQATGFYKKEKMHKYNNKWGYTKTNWGYTTKAWGYNAKKK